MRLTTVLRRLLSVTQMYVKHVEVVADGRLQVSVEPSWRRVRCGTCGHWGAAICPPPRPGGVWAASVRGAG